MNNIKIELPEDFYNTEERNGFEVSSEMKKVWAVLLDLLNEFERVCSKHDIRWFADGGTILGAVRHKGFIPWDDDIDVMMLREDYDRFCKLATKEFAHPYFLQTDETDPTSMRGHAQLRNSETTGILSFEQNQNIKFNQGIFLDIFPIEDVPDDNILFEQQIKNVENLKAKTYNAVYYSHRFRFVPSFNSIKSTPKFIYYKLFKDKNWYIPFKEQFEKECIKYKGNKSKRICKLVLTPIKPRRFWEREWLNDVVYLDFEMRKIPVPIGYIELLNQFYGDWKTFKIGTATHGGCILDPNISYREYLRINKKTFVFLLIEKLKIGLNKWLL